MECIKVKICCSSKKMWLVQIEGFASPWKDIKNSIDPIIDSLQTV